MKPLEASKWLSCQLLVEYEEMRALIASLGEFHIAMTGCVNRRGGSFLTRLEFLEVYRRYLDNLKQGREPLNSQDRKVFSAVFTTELDHLYTLQVEGDKEIVRVVKPVLQLQYHEIGFSEIEKKFRPMVFGKECLSWGLQFSFPQMVKDGETQEIHKSSDYPNAPLYRKVQQWVRQATLPTPFVVEGEQINVPMRLGKGCLPWINAHPGLVKKNLHVIIR